jgi:20S proteasome alpha/beta subunit
MTVKKLLSLAAYVITETASQDGKVGGSLQMCIITPSDGVKVINSQEIGEIVKSNESKSERLRELFWGEGHE